MDNNLQNNKEKRCLICNKPYNHHYDLFGRSCLANLYTQLNISNSRLISNKEKHLKKEMHIKNIIFDNGGVLSNPKTGNWFITTNFWNIINIDAKNNMDIMKGIMKKYQYKLTQEPKTELEEHNMFSNFYYQVLKEFGYKNLSKEIANKLAGDCVYNDDKYIFFSDVNKELEKLSTKYDLYMITDAWPSSFRVLDNRNISKYFKNIMISSMESKTKLDGLFKIFLEKNNNIIPEKSIFIDDRSDILDEATKCGFNAILMDRKRECSDSKYNIIHELSEIEIMVDRSCSQ